jgi:uncharacterized RDD family membrane protein YckC
MTGSYLTVPEIYSGDVATVTSVYRVSVLAFRFGALLIDAIVLGSVFAYPYHLLGWQRTWPAMALVGGLYFVLLEGRWGATLGKVAMRIRVVDGRGRPPGYLAALVRMVFRIFELLPAGLPAILAAGLSRSKQRLGDMVAGTYVVYRDDLRRVRGTVPAA